MGQEQIIHVLSDSRTSRYEESDDINSLFFFGNARESISFGESGVIKEAIRRVKLVIDFRILGHKRNTHFTSI
jgi:hypothetical protein